MYACIQILYLARSVACMCAHSNTNVWIYAYVHILYHTRPVSCKCTHLNMNVCMNLYPSSCSSCCMCVYTHVYECIHIRISLLWLILSSACVHKRICIYTYIYVQPIAFEVSCLHFSQCHFFILKSTFGLVLYVSFATLCRKETKDIEIGDWDEMTLQTQYAVHPSSLLVLPRVCVQVCKYMYTYMYIFIRARPTTCICARMYVYVYILYIFVYIFAYSASVGRDKGTHMHTHTRTHTHTYIHTHTKAYMRTPLVCSWYMYRWDTRCINEFWGEHVHGKWGGND